MEVVPKVHSSTCLWLLLATRAPVCGRSRYAHAHAASPLACVRPLAAGVGRTVQGAHRRALDA
eukprot:1970744-Prymnesium_polylepis.1